MPGDEEGTGEKCGEAAERFAGNSYLSEGLFMRKGKKVISRILTHDKVISTERARRDEEVGFGITSFGVVVKKI